MPKRDIPKRVIPKGNNGADMPKGNNGENVDITTFPPISQKGITVDD